MTLKLIRDKFLQALDYIDEGALRLTLPDGLVRDFAGKRAGVAANMEIHDWRVLGNLARGGDTALAMDYAQGLWRTDCLEKLLTLALRNENAVRSYIFGGRWMTLINRLSYLLRLNTRRGSRRNIEAHYDLGNAFYKLWLDPSMTYSSALYRVPGDTLTTAQHNKYDRILERLGTSSGRTLEIGCGWGGYAERALGRGDFAIKGITLSQEQAMFARERLGSKSTITLEDYRDQRGQYDQIVSIEMFEAVGEKYWGTYFGKIGELLKSSGRAVVQTITIDDQLFDAYRTGQDFVRSFIFPGGMLPSPSRFIGEAAKAGLKVTDRFDFGQDYARTLEVWLQTFDAQKAAIADLGYDEKFIRLWRFYLAACSAGFATNRTDVSQFELQHA